MSGNAKKTKVRNIAMIAIGLIAIVILAIIFMRGDQLEHLIKTIEQGTPAFLVLGAIFQLGKYFVQGLSFLWCFKGVNERLPFMLSVKLVFQTFFIDTMIPSFNISGTSVVVEAASKLRIEPGKSIGAALLRQVSISAAFIVVMVIGFAILWITGGLKIGWVILGAVSIVIVGALVAAMVLAAMKPQWVLRIAAPFEKITDKVLARFKKSPVDNALKSLVDTYSASAKLLLENKRDIFWEFLFAVLANVCEVLCFGFVGLAFGLHNFEAVICVYVVATLCAMASPIPQGVGVVEAGALVAFTLFGIEQATGMAIIMVYRVIVFWMPFIIGAVLMGKSGVDMMNGGGMSLGSIMALDQQGDTKAQSNADVPSQHR